MNYQTHPGTTARSTVALRNSGNVPATINDVQLRYNSEGTRDDGFTIVDTDCRNVTLQPEDYCSVTIEFTPPDPGTYDNTLYVFLPEYGHAVTDLHSDV